MKKYLILGFVVVLIGVSGALVWQAKSSRLTLKGISGEAISAEDLNKWDKSSDNMQTEVQGNQLYIQESIGSEGVALVYPQKISGDFIFKFKLMSLTQTGKIKIISRNDDGDYEYIVELQQLRSKQTAKIWRDGALVGQADAFTLKPDVFYQIIFERSGRQLNLEIDGKTVISSKENKPAQNATLGIRIEGRPDHPAAIEIKDVELYYNR